MEGYTLIVQVHPDIYETMLQSHTLDAASKLIGVPITPEMIVVNETLDPEETRLVYKKNA